MIKEINYWKGKPRTTKEGMCGTKDYKSNVPDSEEATEEEYNNYISSINSNKTQNENLIELFSKATTNEEKIDIIAKRIGLKT